MTNAIEAFFVVIGLFSALGAMFYMVGTADSGVATRTRQHRATSAVLLVLLTAFSFAVVAGV